MDAVTIRIKFSAWFSKCSTKEEIETLHSVITEEAQEAKEDRYFDLQSEEVTA